MIQGFSPVMGLKQVKKVLLLKKDAGQNSFTVF
jgi:hypothetical protein